MAKHVDTLGTLDNFQAPWETATGEDQALNPSKLKKFLYNLLLDKAKAQDARDEADGKVTALTTELETAKADVAKGDPTGKIADLEAKLAEQVAKTGEAELKADKILIGIEKGLNAKQAARLQGTTKEEIESDADEILELFGPPKKNETDEEREEREEAEAEEAEANELRRSPRSPLINPTDAQTGGGQEPDYEKIADQVFSNGFRI